MTLEYRHPDDDPEFDDGALFAGNADAEPDFAGRVMAAMTYFSLVYFNLDTLRQVDAPARGIAGEVAAELEALAAIHARLRGLFARQNH